MDQIQVLAEERVDQRKMRVQIFELGVGKRTVIPLKDLIPQAILETVHEWGETLGVGLTVTDVKDASRFVQHYFTEQGYVVVNLQNRDMKIRDWLEHDLKLPTNVAAAAMETGAPDFFCHKSEEDWFFAEAKNQKDGIRVNQLNWLYNHKYPTKIVHLAEVGEID